MRLVACLLVLLAAGAARAEHVVTVLYFDNDTGNAAYDVLGKGLADMMVTDLSAVPGLEVVEREKLEALLAELKLQRTRYFDPKTAQRIGKGIGAEYAVSGSFASVEPSIRIDVRVIRIATGEVVKAAKVVGKKEQFFELQSQLVAALVDGLGAKMAGKAQGGVDDLGTALAYGKGLDLRDRGDLQSASREMQKVMEKAPKFALARSRYMQIMKELYAAKGKRVEVLSQAEAELLASLDRRIAADAKRLKEDGSYRLNWRMSVPALALRADVMLRRVAEHLDRPAAELKPHVDAYLAAQEKVLAHQLALMGDGPYAFGYGLCHDTDWRHACLTNEDLERATDLGLADPTRNDHVVEGHQILQDVHGLLMFGDKPFYSAVKLPRRVCLYKLDASYPKRALDLLDRGIKLLGKYHDEYDAKWVEDEHLSQYLQRAMHFVVLNRPEDAISSLQTALTRFPKAKRFTEVEAVLQSILAGENKWPNGQPLIPRCVDPGRAAP
jgi:TolB-like protein